MPTIARAAELAVRAILSVDRIGVVKEHRVDVVASGGADVAGVVEEHRVDIVIRRELGARAKEFRVDVALRRAESDARVEEAFVVFVVSVDTLPRLGTGTGAFVSVIT